MHSLKEYYSNLKRLTAHRSYRRLLIGGAVSALGDRVGYIAFLGAVTSHSSDALAVGGITIAEMLPPLIAAPLVSLIVDRYDKRKLMFIADLIRGVLFLIAAYISFVGGEETNWLLFVVAFLASGFMVLFEPARQALEPHYIPEGELTQANGIRMGFMSAVMICGPALGGVLVATVGVPYAFLIDGLSFFVSAWMVSDLTGVFIKREEHEGSWKELMGGFRTVRESSNLIFLFALFASFLFVVGIQFPLMYVFVHENLGGGPAETGWLFSAIGVGGIIGGALLASLKKEQTYFETSTASGRRHIAALVIADGLVVILLAALHSWLASIIVFMSFGVIGTTLHTAFQAAVAANSPDHMRGRVFALHSALSGALIVLSVGLGTPLARKLGAAPVFFMSGAMEVLVGGAAALLAGSLGKSIMTRDPVKQPGAFVGSVMQSPDL